MRFASKRRATGWMALAAVVFGFLPLSVRAGENGYALHFSRDAYVCAAPFVADYTVTGENGKAVFSGENFVEVYHLTADWAEDGQEVSIAAYSADAAAGVPGHTAYRRVGLEDSGYFSPGTAGKIRAVVLASYPRRDPASIQANANLWLQSHGLPELQHLRAEIYLQ